MFPPRLQSLHIIFQPRYLFLIITGNEHSHVPADIIFPKPQLELGRILKNTQCLLPVSACLICVEYILINVMIDFVKFIMGNQRQLPALLSLSAAPDIYPCRTPVFAARPNTAKKTYAPDYNSRNG